jgi:hypothetical protein
MSRKFFPLLFVARLFGFTALEVLCPAQDRDLSEGHPIRPGRLPSDGHSLETSQLGRLLGRGSGRTSGRRSEGGEEARP